MDRARIVAHDAPYDPWPSAMTVNEGIRAIQRKSRGVGIRSPHLGRRGGAPHQAANGGLSSCRFFLLQNRHFRHPLRLPQFALAAALRMRKQTLYAVIDYMQLRPYQ